MTKTDQMPERIWVETDCGDELDAAIYGSKPPEAIAVEKYIRADRVQALVEEMNQAIFTLELAAEDIRLNGIKKGSRWMSRLLKDAAKATTALKQWEDEK